LKENIFYVFVLFFMVACGAQNSPTEEVSVLSGSGSDAVPTPIDTIEDTVLTNKSAIILPKAIAIDFPKELNSSSNPSFNKNVSRVQKVIDDEKFNLELLELAIDEITKECPDNNTTCHFEKDHFRVNHNHQTIILGEIRFEKYELNSTNGYNLLLNLNDNISIQYEWIEAENNVFTTYLDANNSVELHYFTENNTSEALYIDDNLENEKNSFMINLENNGSSLYLLSSNHIKDNKQDFSSSLRVEDTVLVEDNASFFNFTDTNDTNTTNDTNDTNTTNDVNITNDVNTTNHNLSLGLGTLSVSSSNDSNLTPDSVVLLNLIEDKDLKDGDYLLFTADTEVETLNLIEQLKLTVGRFTYFKGEVFGLVVNVVDNESFSELQIIPLK